MKRMIAFAALVGSALYLRPRMLRWGATGSEALEVYPGDDLIEEPTSCTTMAVTLPAPPERVWEWLVQMGIDRAGWYSWDRFDNGGRPSADHIEKRWQDVKVGDHIDMSPDGDLFFVVETADRPSTLVLRADLALPSGRSFDARGPMPQSFSEGIWGFHLTSLPGERARLVVRSVGRGSPRSLMRVLDVLVGQPVHLFMQVRQFTNLRRRLTPSG